MVVQSVSCSVALPLIAEVVVVVLMVVIVVVAVVVLMVVVVAEVVVVVVIVAVVVAVVVRIPNSAGRCLCQHNNTHAFIIIVIKGKITLMPHIHITSL
jgi:hypothetical protein